MSSQSWPPLELVSAYSLAMCWPKYRTTSWLMGPLRVMTSRKTGSRRPVWSCVVLSRTRYKGSDAPGLRVADREAA